VKAKVSEVTHCPCASEDKVSLLKLGSAAAVSLRKRLRKVLSTVSSRKSTLSVRNILVKRRLQPSMLWKTRRKKVCRA